MLSGKERSLLEALAPTAEEKNMEIVTVEVVGSKKAPTIRVFIDCEGGIGFDELSSSQQWIDEIIDRLDPFPGAYTLEVSSPGIDRPLRTIEHFQRAVGERIDVMLTSPIEGRAKWKATLSKVEGNEIIVTADGISTAIPYDVIKKAHVIGTINFKKEERDR